jgi:hypothetical protein
VSQPPLVLTHGSAKSTRATIDWRSVAAILALAGLVCSGMLIAAGSASRASSFVPASRGGFPGWLQGPFGELDLVLDRSVLAALIIALSLCYLVALWLADSIPVPAAIGAIVTLHGIFLLAPPLLSADVLGYISFARLGALHGLNPYVHSASAATGDPSYPYLGWPHSTSPYGPLFTLASYGLAPIGVPAALWSLKAIAAAASLGCTVLVARLARRFGRSPLVAAVFFGLNPILLIWAVGGAHNDLLLMLVVLTGMTFVTARRPGAGLGALVAACGIKVWSALILPFAFIGTRGRGLVVAVATLGSLVLATLVGFGGHGLGFEHELFAEQRLVATHSVPNQLGLLIGLGGLTKGLRILALASFVGAAAAVTARVRRGADWMTSAGWLTLSLLLCSAWLLPWYAVWVLPFAAVGKSVRLQAATLIFTGYLVASHVPAPFGG